MLKSKMVKKSEKATAALIRREREERDLYQGDVARRLGIPQPRLSQIENGRRPVSIEEFLRIAEAVGFDAMRAIREVRARIQSKKII
jgi:transcriptional regulator with XRE-family HTH domain